MELLRRFRIPLCIMGGLICFGLAGTLIWTFSGRWNENVSTVVAGPAPAKVKEADRTESSPGNIPQVRKVQEPWFVYVTGAVRKPGVYKVHPGSRVYELVDMAGGLSSKADSRGVNLAVKLKDEMHVHVPEKSREPVRHVVGPVSPSPANDAHQVRRSVVNRAGSVSVSARININVAAAEDLQRLRGIGPKTARSIIEYRKAHGVFNAVDELLRVKGIGPKKLAAIRENITVR